MAFLVTMIAMLATLEVSASRESVTPIQKVLSMMEDMKSKGVKAKKDEEVRFGAFQQWCSGTSSSRQEAIENGAAKIEKLDADIATATSDIEGLTRDLAELDEDLGRWDTDKKAATDVRKKERADYMSTHEEYADITDSLDRAIARLKQMPEKIAQSAFIQTHVESVAKSQTRVEAHRSLVALLATVSNPLDVQNPAAHAYESQSGGVIQMLEDLRVRFRGEKTDLEKEEMSNRAAYQAIMQRLTDQIELAEQETSQKTKQRATRKADKAEAEGDMKETQRVKAEDEKYLSDLKALCSRKSSDFESRQELRAGEIEALSKAIEIIGSQSVKGSGEKHLPSAALAQQTAALAQLRASAAPCVGCQKVASLLSERARLLHNPTLAMVAQKATTDPFAKVKKMIKDLLTKLMEESAGEADHKAFCDAELATNKQTRTNKAESVEELTAEVEKQTAISAKLASDIADLSDEISELDAAMAKATSQRHEEKEKNTATVADAKEAQTAVAQALAVLRDFYAKAAEATALVQQSPAQDAPETFDSAYTGMGSSSTGVVGMLEVIESDFARLETSTDSSEDEAASQFKKFMADSNEDKALKNTEMEHKTNKRTTTEEVLVSTKRSLDQTQKELDAALDYYAKLKPDCVDSGMSYEERVKRREEELESLQDAYKILAGEELPSLSDMKAEQIQA
jgi:hypothetical protein